MIWELFVCIGVTWAGCGSAVINEYPSEEACYRALNTMHKAEKTLAYCRQKRKEKG
jgi:hypothetical protein